jgi:hypothetical protein
MAGRCVRCEGASWKGDRLRPVERIVAESRALRLPRLYLYTPKAERLYARLGWTVLERTQYREMEVVIMTLDLDL